MSINDYKDIRIVYAGRQATVDVTYKDCKCNIGSDCVILTMRSGKFVYFNMRYVVMIQEVEDLVK